jgi:hypothetical protein
MIVNHFRARHNKNNSYVSFYAILSCLQTIKNRLICGEWRKNAVQAAHFYSQRYPNRPISSFYLTLISSNISSYNLT